ncbi:hypothetical protein [Saccharopolyspora karakumensis]|uniref:hypothetical protein n=1 Tax=Saccharopolyspora karakumensis TaxID=2530386 RepID=UPI001A9D8D04
MGGAGRLRRRPAPAGYTDTGTVHKHIRSIFAELDLPPDDRADRRVTAVLRYLERSASRAR